MNRHVRTQVEFRMRVERVGEGRGGRKRKECEGQKRRRLQRERGGWRRGDWRGEGEDKEEANRDCRVSVIQRGGVYN